MIVDPMGVVLASVGEEQGLGTAAACAHDVVATQPA
jgi:hypothetical protein